MEEKEKIEKIFNQFMQEEAGNRLSQFSMLALKQMVLIEVDKMLYKIKEDNKPT